MGTTSPQSTTRLDLYTENDTNSLKQGIGGYGVLYGLTQTLGTGLQVIIATGAACFGTTLITKVAPTTLTMSAADGTMPRKDIIYMNSSGTLAVATGTPAGATPSDGSTKFQLYTPFPPEVPANCIIICEVYIAANQVTLGSGDTLDKRVLVNRTLYPSHIISAGAGIKFFASDGVTVLAELDDSGNFNIKGRFGEL